jgi:hypothetical protein
MEELQVDLMVESAFPAVEHSDKPKHSASGLSELHFIKTLIQQKQVLVCYVPAEDDYGIEYLL